MPSKSKAKGNRYERECVNKALEHGLESKRAWGSDGRSLGLHAEVDMVIEDFTVQCKVRKRIAEWIKPSGGEYDKYTSPILSPSTPPTGRVTIRATHHSTV